MYNSIITYTPRLRTPDIEDQSIHLYKALWKDNPVPLCIKSTRAVNMFQNYFQIFWRVLLASGCQWRTEGVEILYNARLFTRVVKLDFTEHRRGAVCAQRADDNSTSFFSWKKLFVFSWASVTSLVVTRLSHMKNSVFLLNFIYRIYRQ